MTKAAAAIGGVLIVLGVALGFVGSQDCGSVFRGPDTRQQSVDQYTAAFLGEAYEYPDCSSATDLTVPVWLLIGVGGVLLAGAGVRAAYGYQPQTTADTQDAMPSGNDVP